MTLSIGYYRIMEVVQALTIKVMSDVVHPWVFSAHVTLISVSRTLFKSPGQ